MINFKLTATLSSSSSSSHLPLRAGAPEGKSFGCCCCCFGCSSEEEASKNDILTI